MNVPFIDLKKQLDPLRTEVTEAIIDVIDKAQFILGENVSNLEKNVGSYLGIAECVGVGNGSDALLLSLMAYDIGPGDEVITTPFSFIATADAILRTGATPVFSDIDLKDYNIDPKKIEKLITPRTKAIIPVHLYGQCAQMDRIVDLAKKYSLLVIEDACQAFGASYQGRKAGTWGDVGCFSFFPTKNLGGCGDGGMIVTSDHAIAKKLRKLRMYGSESRYHHDLLGMNSRLDEIQAAVLRIKLRYIDSWNDRRRVIAAKYNSLLKDLPLHLPIQSQDTHHIYHLFVIRLFDHFKRDQFISFLNENGIGTSIHYPKPIYLQPSYRLLGCKEGICPKAEIACDQVVAIPLYPEMTDEMVQQVATVINAYFKGGKTNEP